MTELRHRAKGYDVIGVTESWARDSILDAELAIDGFRLFRADRRIVKGRGLLLYVKENLNATICTEMSKTQFDESLWCTISTGPVNQKLLVGLIYRSPSSSCQNNDALLKAIESATEIKDVPHVLIMGDMNYPEIDFVTNSVNAGTDAAPTKFLDKIQELFLYQHVTQFTRFRSNHEPSVLDYVITDDGNLIDEIHYDAPLGKSDHLFLSWFITLHVQQMHSCQEKLNFWKGDYAKINEALSNIDWKVIFCNQSVEEMWTSFKEIILRLTKLYVPIKKERKPRKNDWISKPTIKQMKLRSAALKKYRRYPSGRNRDHFLKLRNIVVNSVRSDEDSHRKHLLKNFKGQPKRFYSYMRKLQTVKDSVITLLKPDGKLTETDKEAADLLGSVFSAAYTKEDMTGFKPEHDGSHLGWQDSSVKLGKEEVLGKLLKLREDSSPGPDGIHPMLLKSCAGTLAEPLSVIFQTSFESGVVPADWKTALVTPIFKKGSRSDPANYRPISLTSVCCKLLESLIRQSLTDFLDSNDAISKKQHGFVKGRSCLTNLLECFECWTKALDEGFGIDLLYLDFRKAFDSIPLRRLIEKLKSDGLSGKLLEWISDFLMSRTMKVGLRGSFSALLEVLSGVPQGSVIGPLLFLLYVNDLPDWILSSMQMFADDTKLWRVIRSKMDIDLLQEDLNSLAHWCNKYLLTFNPQKCKVMHVGHKTDSTYYMPDAQDSSTKHKIEASVEERDLGVMVTDNLKPSAQCVKAAGKARAVLGLVKRNFRKLDESDFLILYKTYIRPHMEYCVQAWSPYLQKDIQILEKIQRAATKIVPHLKTRSYEDRLSQLGLTTLETRRRRGDLIEAFKIMTDREKLDKNQFFSALIQWSWSSWSQPETCSFKMSSGYPEIFI